MNYVLFDGVERNHLLPLAFTRPIAAFRVGILTIHEKWEKHLGKVSFKTETYLALKYPLLWDNSQDTIWINGSVCPTAELVIEIRQLSSGQALTYNNSLIAIHSGKQLINPLADQHLFTEITSKQSTITQLKHLWSIFLHNHSELIADYQLLSNNNCSQPISATNRVISPENVFLEEGVKMEYAILNASTGPIYIGKNAQIMENSVIRGPFALGEGATLKLSSKIYGATTIGPYAVAGGEIKNSVLFGYSNKGHDGYLGNSVIGEWCNIGADSNTSNLKNNYSTVKLWNYANKCYEATNQQFCGLFMADYSKCSINTMFNTGTVVGVNVNVVGAGFPEKFIADFTWGGIGVNTTYRLLEALESAERAYKLKNKPFTEIEKNILTTIYNLTTK